MGIWLCSQGTSNRTRGKGLWLCHGAFRLDHWENFPKSVVELWPRLPRTVLESPSLEGFKSRVDLALGDMVWWWAVLGEQLGSGSFSYFPGSVIVFSWVFVPMISVLGSSHSPCSTIQTSQRMKG